MNCETVKELLITDYIDNELDAEKIALVKGHLAKCSACMAFEAEVRRLAVGPFKDIKPIKPEEAVWRNIADSIKEPVRSGRGFHAKPIFLVATMAVILIVAAVFLNNHYAEQRSLGLYIEEELGYLASLGANNATTDEDSIGELFTG